MSSCLGIEGLSSLLICLHPSVIGSQGTSLYQVTVGRLSLTTSRGMSLGCCVDGRPLYLVRLLCIVLFFVCLLAWTIHPILCVCVCVCVCVCYLFILFFKPKIVQSWKASLLSVFMQPSSMQARSTILTILWIPGP